MTLVCPCESSHQWMGGTCCVCRGACVSMGTVFSHVHVWIGPQETSGPALGWW